MCVCIYIYIYIYIYICVCVCVCVCVCECNTPDTNRTDMDNTRYLEEWIPWIVCVPTFTNLLYTRQEYKTIATAQNFLVKLRVSHFVISVTLHCIRVQEAVDITVCACSPRMASSHCSLGVFIQVFAGKLSLRCRASRWKLLIMGSSRDLLVVIWAQYLVPRGNY